MQFQVEPIINELPTSVKPFYKLYKGNGLAAKLAYRRSKWVHLRTRLAEAQNWKCCFCGCYMDHIPGKKTSVTVEHVLPKSKGGTDDPSNLAASCHTCNNNRGNLDAGVFERSKDGDTVDMQRVRLEAKVRKYLKRARHFAEIGFDMNDRIQSFEDWFTNLRLNAEGKKMFMAAWSAI